MNPLNDDNIFNYNDYFKKRYQVNKGFRTDLSDPVKNLITKFVSDVKE